MLLCMQIATAAQGPDLTGSRWSWSVGIAPDIYFFEGRPGQPIRITLDKPEYMTRDEYYQDYGWDGTYDGKHLVFRSRHVKTDIGESLTYDGYLSADGTRITGTETHHGGGVESTGQFELRRIGGAANAGRSKGVISNPLSWICFPGSLLVLGWLLTRGRKAPVQQPEDKPVVTPEDKPDEPAPPQQQPPAREDPCLKSRQEYEVASAKARVIAGAIENWERLYADLENAWESVRETAIRNGLVDIGFMVGSLGSRVAVDAGVKWFGGWLTSKFLAKTLAEKLIEASLKSLLKGAAKDWSKYLKEIGSKQAQDVGKKYLQEFGVQEMTKSLTPGLQRTLLDSSKDPSGGTWFTPTKPYTEVEKFAKDNYAKPVTDFLGDLQSLYNLGMDAMTSHEQLELIEDKRRTIRDEIARLRPMWDDAKGDEDVKRAALNGCESSETYQRYLKYLAFLALPQQG